MKRSNLRTSFNVPKTGSTVNPISMQRTADLLEVVVENPFDELLVAGALAACYEAVEGTEPEVTFQTVAEETFTLQVQPKGS